MSVATSPDPRSMAKRLTTPTVWLDGSDTQTATCWPVKSQSTTQFSTLSTAETRRSAGNTGGALGCGVPEGRPPASEALGLEVGLALVLGVASFDAVATGVGLALGSWLAVEGVADGVGTTPASDAGSSFTLAHESR
jgi:hypothetical protein